MMKLVLVTNFSLYPAIGGANKANLAIVNLLAEKKFSCLIVCPVSTTSEMPDECHLQKEFDTHSIFKIKSADFVAVREKSNLSKVFADTLVNFDPDIILVSSEDPSQTLLSIAVKFDPGRTVYLAHTPLFFPFGPNSFFPGIARTEVFKQCRAVIAVSRFVKEYIAEYAGIASTHTYIPVFETTNDCFGKFDNPYVLLVNASRLKGLQIFLGLAQLFPNTRFAAVKGWATSEADLAALSKFSNVEILEPTPEIDLIYKKTKILIVPSLIEEAFGQVLVEAMQRGIPVLASDLGGLKEATLGAGILLPVKKAIAYRQEFEKNALPEAIIPDQDVGLWQSILNTLLTNETAYYELSSRCMIAATDFVKQLKIDALAGTLYQIAIDNVLIRERASEQARKKVIDFSLKQKEDTWKRLQQRRNPGKLPRIDTTSFVESASLSSQQRRMWIYEIYHKNSYATNITRCFEATAITEIHIVKECLNKLEQQYQILRTTFHDAEGGPRQVIHEPRGVNILTIEAEGEKGIDDLVRDVCEREQATQFDIGSLHLFRVVVVKTERSCYFIITFHHIIFDMMSISLFFEELASRYMAAKYGRSHKSETILQYVHYCAWLEQIRQTEVYNEWRMFWDQTMQMLKQRPGLITDRRRGNIKGEIGARIETDFGVTAKESSSRVAKFNATTPFPVLIASVKALLARYTHDENTLVGILDSGRIVPELNRALGCFMNVLPVHSAVPASGRFHDIVRNESMILSKVIKSQHYLVDEVLEKIPYHAGHAQLVDILVTVDEQPLQSSESIEASEVLGIRSYNYRQHIHCPFDIIFNFSISGSSLKLDLIYDKELFEYETMQSLVDNYGELSAQLFDAPDVPIVEAKFPIANDILKITNVFNDTERYYEPKTLYDLYSETLIRRRFDKIIRVGEKDYSLSEINEWADCCAWELSEGCNVTKGDVVIVCMERSVQLLVAIVANLKCGSVYLPVDSKTPSHRFDQIIEESKAKAIVVDASSLPACEGRNNVLNIEGIAQSGGKPFNAGAKVTPSDPAYIIFTSGSTGKPKGAVLRHEGIVNRLNWKYRTYNLTDNDVVLQKTTFTFDVSVWELYLPLCFGVRSVMSTGGGNANPDNIVRYIEGSKVTLVHFVPGMLHVFLQYIGSDHIGRLRSLKHVFCSGEELQTETADLFFRKIDFASLHNLYGPTEASIDVTGYTLHGGEKEIPIGKPIDNIRLFVLDDRGGVLPVGARGELYIGGIGVADGYINNAQLTDEKFIIHPAFGRLYRTGDYAHWRNDGNLIFDGRIDGQVKVRGYRIERTEIESLLNRFDGVNQSVIIVSNEEKYGDRLVAFYTGQPLDPQKVKNYLSGFLPSYCIPSHFIHLQDFPRTSNGKISTRDLERYSSARDNDDDTVLSNPIQSRLLSIWNGVLKVKKVAVHDNFFVIGGHSLAAIKIASQISTKFVVHFRLEDFFECPTISQQAALIEERTSTNSKIQGFDDYPWRTSLSLPPKLTPAQQLLLSIQMIRPDSSAYNIHSVLKVEGHINREALHNAHALIQQRFDILRTTFQIDEHGILPVVSPGIREKINVIDSKHLDLSESQLMERIRLEISTPFDLSMSTYRISLFECDESNFFLVICMHHAIADGWSMNILANDLIRFYRLGSGATVDVAKLEFQYSNYAAWLDSYLKGPQGKTHKHYWLSLLQGSPWSQPFIFGALPGGRHARTRLTLDDHTLEGLRMTASSAGVSLYAVLLSSVQYLLCKYLRKPDIVIGIATSGRFNIDLESQFGNFVSLLPINVRVEDDQNFIALVRRSAALIASAIDHQLSPIKEVVQELRVKHNINFPWPPQVIVTLQNQEFTAIDVSLEDVKISAIELEPPGSQQPVNFSFLVANGKLVLDFHYDPDLFQQAEVDRILKYYERLVSQLIREL